MGWPRRSSVNSASQTILSHMGRTVSATFKTLLFTMVKSFQLTSLGDKLHSRYENATFIKFGKRDSRKILKQQKSRNNGMIAA